MIESECPNCGGRVFILGKSCPHCGAANKARVAGLLVAGALAMLLVAVVVAVAVLLRGQRLPGADTPDTPGSERVETKSTGDLGWLTAAMSECEAEAMKNLDTLYFLVLPLASLPADEEQWREKSISNIGNAILLRSDDALEGLRSGTLRLYPGEYDFRIIDGSNTVYKWKPAVGVTKISAPDAGSIVSFRLQFQTSGSADGGEWGTPFPRKSGTCYWVNAIVGH
jgi:hypothetical protein